MKKGCGGRYCWGKRGPGEGVAEEPGSGVSRRSSRLGMGCRVVRGVAPLSGRGGLLWPRLMTGMCGGRGQGEDDAGRETDAEEEEEDKAGGGSGQGEVLAGAGSSGGGGDDKVGQDPPADPAGAPGLSPPNSAPASVPRATGSGVAVGERLSCDGSWRLAPSSLRSSKSEDVSARDGLPAAEEQGEERGWSMGEAGVRVEGSNFSIMVPTLRHPPVLLLWTSSDVQVCDLAAISSLHERDSNVDFLLSILELNSAAHTCSAALPLSKYQRVRRSAHHWCDHLRGVSMSVMLVYLMDSSLHSAACRRCQVPGQWLQSEGSEVCGHSERRQVGFQKQLQQGRRGNQRSLVKILQSF